MGKRPSSKPQPVTKAKRVNTGIKHRRTHLTEIQKILLGGGSLRNVQKRWEVK